MKKNIFLVVSILVCLVVTLAFSGTSVYDDGFDKTYNVPKEIVAAVDELSESMVLYPYAYYDIMHTDLFSKNAGVVSDDMVAGYSLYDGHFHSDWRTNGFDETVLMALRKEYAYNCSYYSALKQELVECMSVGDNEKADGLIKKIFAASDIISNLKTEIGKALPNYSE